MVLDFRRLQSIVLGPRRKQLIVAGVCGAVVAPQILKDQKTEIPARTRSRYITFKFYSKQLRSAN